MGIEPSGQTWEPSRKSLGNVLNALNCVPVKNGLNGKFYVTYILLQKKKKFRRHSADSLLSQLKAWP